jgi:hypothetical protein
MNFRDVKVGDKVARAMAGTVVMELTVTEVDDKLIHCADWTFDRDTGAEVDEYLGWGPDSGGTGSYLVETNTGKNPNIIVDK